MEQPLVSVLMITYNHEPYISLAIEGVLMQKISFPIEFIIADDASTDNNQKIIRKYAEKYKIIKPIFREVNLGANTNWIDAANQCQGKYIALCEGDDYWTDPYKLQKQVEFLESSYECVVCGHAIKKVDVKSSLLAVFNRAGKFFQHDLFISYPIPTLSAVFRRDFIDFKLLNSASVVNGDLVLMVGLLNHGYGYNFDEVMGVQIVHENGVWEKKSSTIKANAMLTTIRFLENTNGKLSQRSLRALRSLKRRLVRSPFTYVEISLYKLLRGEVNVFAFILFYWYNLKNILRRTLVDRF